MSWRHFQYGLRSIAREATRQQLAMSQAYRMATLNKDEWGAYQRDMSRLTEVPKHG